MNRREIIEYFDNAMSTRRDAFLETGQNPHRGTHLKSSVLESNVSDRVGNGSGEVFQYLAASPISKWAKITSTEDTFLYKIEIQNEDGITILDTIDKRFWVLHSTLPSDPFDRLESTLSSKCDLLDSLWIPSELMLNWLPLMGAVRELGVKYGAKMPDFQPNANNSNGYEGFSMRWTMPNHLVARWEEVGELEVISSRLAVWSGKVVARHPDQPANANFEVTAYGRMTARGNSFLLHQEMLNMLMEFYRALLRDFEEKYRPKFASVSHLDIGTDNSSDRVVMKGRPARIQFPSKLDDDRLGQLVEMMSAADNRMRLYGVPYEEGPGRFHMSAIDLHSSDRLRLEILRTHVAVHLHHNACGNVLARLLTNLQHHFDARIRLADG
jgi:hypothetical protein